ncbi:hypothetical protein ACFVFJ_50140, partial [Streptomyces sp. NPDC057717]|uniref:hypothetical protein n=1 Tax=Streptomyces sp. NPDC057717 TaxID=3346224 RepID=UPI0036AA9F48
MGPSGRRGAHPHRQHRHERVLAELHGAEIDVRFQRLGQFDEALKSAAEYQDIFGKDRYFLELMDH